MVKPTCEWFHQVLGHPGERRLHQTLTARYYHPQLRSVATAVVRNCEHCKRHKLEGRAHGLLPLREVRTAPFEEVAVNLIGPWKTKVNGKLVTFSALTIIDTVTNLVELVRIDNKSLFKLRTEGGCLWF